MQDIKLPSLEQKLPSRSILSNLLITLISIGLVVWTFQLLRTRFTSVVSIDAVINGAVVDIKAPQEGVVANVAIATGDKTTSGQSLLVLQNDQVSELKVQEINSRLSQYKADLQSAQAHLSELLALRQVSAADNQTQYHLENLEFQRLIDQVAADLRGAEARLNLAQISRDRSVQLQSEGAVSMANLDSAIAEVEQRQAEVDSLQNRLQSLQANQAAAQQGLTLERTRSNFDPRIRLQELQLQIAEQQQKIQRLEQSIKDTEAELAQAKLDAERDQKVQIHAATTGVMWSLAVQPGTFVQQGESLGKLLDCHQRWVDAFVDERTLRSLQIGSPATIELYGDSSQTLSGRVGIIRSGSGRLSVGEDVAVPVVANMPRKAQVRVNLDPETDPTALEQLCYVGYTGKVTFDIH
jgi:multidrug resistance efflux pump